MIPLAYPAASRTRQSPLPQTPAAALPGHICVVLTPFDRLVGLLARRPQVFGLRSSRFEVQGSKFLVCYSCSSFHLGKSLCATPRWSRTRATTVSTTCSMLRGRLKKDGLAGRIVAPA